MSKIEWEPTCDPCGNYSDCTGLVVEDGLRPPESWVGGSGVAEEEERAVRFGFRASGFGLRVSSFGFHVSSFGFRVSAAR